MPADADLPVSNLFPWVICEIEGNDAIPFQDPPPRVLPTVDDLSQPFVEFLESFAGHGRARKLVCSLPRQLLAFLRLRRLLDHP